MDTIKLKIDVDFNEKRRAFFSEKIQHKEIANNPINKGSSRFVYTANKWRKERMKNGLYTPKFWFQDNFKDPTKKDFYLEISVPKLLNGHNTKDLKSSDLINAVEEIRKFLLEIEIKVFSRQILDATPLLVAFGKNINITNICSCDQAIGILSLFDDRFRSNFYLIKPKNGGVELYYNTKSSTLKVYDKLEEVKNNAITPIEQKIIAALSSKYKQKEVLVCELLRFELTLKGTDSIRKRLKPYLGDKITFENMFKDEIWFILLRNEIERIFSHPIKDFLFLSKLDAPVIEAFLNKNVKHFGTKAIIKEMIEIIQKNNGIKGLKNYHFKNYKSRQTFYNHLSILKNLAKVVNFSENEEPVLSADKIHGYLLQQFKIKTPIQKKLI